MLFSATYTGHILKFFIINTHDYFLTYTQAKDECDGKIVTESFLVWSMFKMVVSTEFQAK
jgi:hypothetical protein